MLIASPKYFFNLEINTKKAEEELCTHSLLVINVNEIQYLSRCASFLIHYFCQILAMALIRTAITDEEFSLNSLEKWFYWIYKQRPTIFHFLSKIWNQPS